VFQISGIARQGTQQLCQAIMKRLEDKRSESEARDVSPAIELDDEIVAAKPVRKKATTKKAVKKASKKKAVRKTVSKRKRPAARVKSAAKRKK
jgi:hypothetical protein